MIIFRFHFTNGMEQETYVLRIEQWFDLQVGDVLWDGEGWFRVLGRFYVNGSYGKRHSSGDFQYDYLAEYCDSQRWLMRPWDFYTDATSPVSEDYCQCGEATCVMKCANCGKLAKRENVL